VNVLAATLMHSLTLETITYRYKKHIALDQLTAEIPVGSLTAILGPNGSGKSTLFKILSTTLPLQKGEAHFPTREGNLLLSLRKDTDAWRAQIAIVFQHPSLDKKLTILENLRYHALLFGIPRATFEMRARLLLSNLKIEDRADHRVETLSGGLARRAEIAKALLPAPRILLLDEPSTGLDPAARRDLVELLRQLNRQEGITILLTTHLIDEAEQAHRVLILHRGRLIAHDTPAALKEQCPYHVIQVQAKIPEGFIAELTKRFPHPHSAHQDRIRIEFPSDRDPQILTQWLWQTLGASVRSITLSPPTLEDVYFKTTGQPLSELQP
jgi:ABC-2 type transport system ATP-binding protein